MRALAGAALVALALAPASSLPSRHEAKVRTFRALLALTEERPDVVDATHAAVTVAGCARRRYGWLCNGSLAPVAFSGITGSTCRYVVRVSRSSARLAERGCS